MLAPNVQLVLHASQVLPSAGYCLAQTLPHKATGNGTKEAQGHEEDTPCAHSSGLCSMYDGGGRICAASLTASS